jgi:hypothetical protein
VSGDEPSPARGEKYLDIRLRPQLQWFERRSRDAKRWGHALAAAQIVATIAIPVVNVFTHSVYVSSILAGIAALATGFENLYGHRDAWLAYRQMARALETLLLRYQLGLSPFEGADKDERLVEETEAALDNEGARWAEGVKQRGGSRGASIVIAG